MKTILIIGAGNLKNNGIYAMVVSVYQNIIKLRSDIEFYMLSELKGEDSEILKQTNITVINEHWVLKLKNKVSFILNLFWNVIYLFFSRFCNIESKYKTLNIYKKCDLIIDLSGDSISTDYGIISLWLVLYRIYLGIIAQKKIILLGQTIGPFNDKMSKIFAKLVLNKVNKLILREERSKNYLEQINLKRSDILITTDNAFLLEPDYILANKAIIKHNIIYDTKRLIGFSPSNIIFRWFKNPLSKQEKKKQYISYLAKFIDRLIEEDKYKVLFIPHVLLSYNDDLQICEDIYRELKNKDAVNIVNDYYNAAVLKAIMSKLKFLISFRMHAAIGALSMNIPVICWSYNDKFEGIIGEKLGLSDYVIDIRQCNIKDSIKKLQTAIEKLESNFHEVRKLVKENVECEKNKVWENIEIVLNTLNDE